MGFEDTHDQIALGGKGEEQVKNMKLQAEEIIEFYKKLKEKNDSHKKSIVGLTTEKDEIRKRIRALLNKQTTAEGPHYDEYKITRKVSKTYEPIDPSKSKVQAAAMKASVSTVSAESAPSLQAVSITVEVKENEEES